MDLVFFAIIAIYFIFKLNSVLGQKDYSNDYEKTFVHSAGSDIPQKDQSTEKVIQAKLELTDEEAIINQNPQIIEILKKIRVIDKNFEEGSFIKSASAAFEMILNACNQNDKNILKMLLSNKIYEVFLSYINDKEQKQITIDQSLVSLKKVEIIKGKLENKMAYLTVQYLSDQIYVVKDKNNNIIEGHPSQIINKIDLWTFSRDISANSPVWELTSTV